MVSNKLELKSEMQKAVNAVNGSVLFFCTVMIQIGPLYMYKDLLFFASSALL